MGQKCFCCGRGAGALIATHVEETPICKECLEVIDTIVESAAVELGMSAGKELSRWPNERPRPGETWLGMLERLKANRCLQQ